MLRPRITLHVKEKPPRSANSRGHGQTLFATDDERAAVERRVIDDLATHDPLFLDVVAMLEDGTYVETGTDPDLTPLKQVVLMALQQGRPRVTPWERDPNPFRGEAVLAYYHRLTAHGYELSEEERQLHEEAAAASTAETDDDQADEGAEYEDAEAEEDGA